MRRAGRGGGPIGPWRQRSTMRCTSRDSSERSSTCRRSPACRMVEPRGGIASSPRTMTLTTASRGSPRSRTRAPTTASSWATGYSRISAPSRLIVPASASGRGRAGSLVVAPSARASGSNVVPWMIVESSTAKKTTSKSWVLPPTPAMTGKVARTTGTAPRSPARREREALAPREARRQGGDGDRDRARDEDEHERQHRPAHGDVVEPAGEDEQAQRDEHRHLPHPGQALVEGGHRLLGGDAGRAQRQPGQVDGEEARSVQGVGAAEGQRGHGERRHRVQARRWRGSRAAAPTPPPPRPPRRRPGRCRSGARRGTAMFASP